MKVITVNEKNIKEVSAKVQKFFNGRNITHWYNYDGGMRPRIPRIASKSVMCLDWGGGDVVRVPKYDTTRMFDNVTCTTIGKEHAVVHLDRYNGFVITKGMRIAFLGNRIITGNNYSITFGKPVWEYNCYQINN